jgi:hypothetical protein
MNFPLIIFFLVLEAGLAILLWFYFSLARGQAWASIPSAGTAT